MNLKRYTYKDMLRMVNNRRRSLLRIWAYCCMGALLSCTLADVVYFQGVVQIYPEYAGYTLPGVEYYFYNTDGQAEPLSFESTDGNFEGVLPEGRYVVIATNTSADSVEFVGPEDYNTFIVKANPFVPGRGIISRANYTMLWQPDSVYSIVIGELDVKVSDTIRLEPKPTLLTKLLTLEFTMEDGLETEVESMTGILPGVYPAVHLFTGEGRQIEESPDMAAVNFETVPEGSNKRKAQILLFGLRDPIPDEGTGYTNELELTLNMKQGTPSSINITVDISKDLSDALKESEGNVLQLPNPVRVRKTPLGIVAEVDEWIEEGEDKEET